MGRCVGIIRMLVRVLLVGRMVYVKIDMVLMGMNAFVKLDTLDRCAMIALMNATAIRVKETLDAMEVIQNF